MPGVGLDPVSTTLGGIQLGVGIYDKIRANKIAKNNIRPVLQDDPYIDEAYNLTASQAQQGLGAGALQAYNTGIDRSLGSSLNALMQSGGNSNNISALFDGAQSSLRQLSLLDQQVQQQNENRFLQANQAKADEDRDQFLINKEAPFKDNAALAASLSGQGMDNAFKGLNTIGGALENYRASKLYGDNKTGVSNAAMPAYIPASYINRNPLIPQNGGTSVKPYFNSVTGTWSF